MQIHKNTVAIVLAGISLLASVQILTAGSTQSGSAAAVADKAAGELMTALKAELQAAMQKGGPAAAIDICSSRAQALTAEIPARINRPDVILKRTSMQYRNPANRPTREEERALNQFAARLSKGAALQPIIEETKTALHYYRPMLTEPLCLSCHGDPGRMDPAVLEALRQRYPEDRAVGFAAGDLRGMVSVTVPSALHRHH